MRFEADVTLAVKSEQATARRDAADIFCFFFVFQEAEGMRYARYLKFQLLREGSRLSSCAFDVLAARQPVTSAGLLPGRRRGLEHLSAMPRDIRRQ